MRMGTEVIQCEIAFWVEGFEEMGNGSTNHILPITNELLPIAVVTIPRKLIPHKNLVLSIALFPITYYPLPIF